MGTDTTLRAAVGGVPAPDLETPAATVAPPLAQATVAIVTTAGMRPAGDVTIWKPTDGSFTQLPRAARDMQLSHFSPNFDRAGVAMDLNVVYPIDRLEEMVAEGTIGTLAETHLSFMGAQFDLSTIIQDTGPAAAQLLLDAGVDVVLLTPV
jgi:D-proline reductase (dithiol) PrdB